jgi:hypothetical protein
LRDINIPWFERQALPTPLAIGLKPELGNKLNNTTLTAIPLGNEKIAD